MIDGELGAFIRSRREAVTPAEVGLPEGTRRRTPGLRRAELATLAGISVDYLIRLEQGRDTHRRFRCWRRWPRRCACATTTSTTCDAWR